MHWLLPELKGARVLMYQHIWPVADHFAVTPKQLDEQFSYLHKNGYKTIFASALINAIFEERDLASKTIVLTFDNGYRNQVEFVEPLLEKYGFCASLFLNGEKVMMGNSSTNGTKQSYLMAENIRKADPTLFEFGMNGYGSRSFAEMNEEQIRSDILMNRQIFSAMNLSVIPVFAYPSHIELDDRIKIDQCKRIMRQCGILAAFRKQNGSVSFPVKDIFELKRIGINGFDDLKRFKIKLKRGRVNIF